MQKFQGNRNSNGEVIEFLDRHRARHLFRSGHLKKIWKRILLQTNQTEAQGLELHLCIICQR